MHQYVCDLCKIPVGKNDNYHEIQISAKKVDPNRYATANTYNYSQIFHACKPCYEKLRLPHNAAELNSPTFGEQLTGLIQSIVADELDNRS